MNALIEQEFAGCMVGLLWIIGMFFVVVAGWYLYTFIVWLVYRYFGGRRGYASYIKARNLNL